MGPSTSDLTLIRRIRGVKESDNKPVNYWCTVRSAGFPSLPCRTLRGFTDSRTDSSSPNAEVHKPMTSLSNERRRQLHAPVRGRRRNNSYAKRGAQENSRRRAPHPSGSNRDPPRRPPASSREYQSAAKTAQWPVAYSVSATFGI